MKRVVALMLCVIAVMSIGGCSSDYKKKSKDDFHNDFIMDIKDTAECTKLYSDKKFFKGDECYMYQLTKEEAKVFEDKIGANWTKLPFEYEDNEKLYKTKEDDGKTISERTGLPLVTSGYWCAKTSKGMVSEFEIDDDFSLAMIDMSNFRLYYFKRSK